MLNFPDFMKNWITNVFLRNPLRYLEIYLFFINLIVFLSPKKRGNLCDLNINIFPPDSFYCLVNRSWGEIFCLVLKQQIFCKKHWDKLLEIVDIFHFGNCSGVLKGFGWKIKEKWSEFDSFDEVFHRWGLKSPKIKWSLCHGWSKV